MGPVFSLLFRHEHHAESSNHVSSKRRINQQPYEIVDEKLIPYP